MNAQKTWREIDMRQNDGLTVVLELCPQDAELRIRMDDAKNGAEAIYPVAKQDAYQAFQHPFVYQP